MPVLKELKEVSGLRTSIALGITAALAFITNAVTVLRALGLLGKPVVTPTAAAKLIQTTPNEGNAP